MKRFFTFLILLTVCIPTFSQQGKTQKQQLKKPLSANPFRDKNRSKTTTDNSLNNFGDRNRNNLSVQKLNSGDPDNSNATAKAISFNGQWKGSFTDNSFGSLDSDRMEYVLELETNGSSVSGYSYTYFFDGGKQFYTICKVRGTVNKATKEIIVSEFERTRFNTPPNFSNCFQTHRLRYDKPDAETEALVGTWVPGPDQQGNCGFGRTYLSRQIVAKNALMKRSSTSTISKPLITKPPVAKVQPKRKVLPAPTHFDTTVTIENERQQQIPALPVKPAVVYKERTKSVLKTFNVNSETIKVEFYDNGEIDGDSISVFYNGKLIVSRLMLTDRPSTFILPIDKTKEVNELVMYAENLGTQPPNTALMVVTYGENRYEVRITSDIIKNGTIYFRYKKPD